MTKGGSELAVVVPVFGNEATLVDLHRRLRAALAGSVQSWELVFVDDASEDGSRQVIADLIAADPGVRLVALERNLGQNRAVARGLAATHAARVVVLDADLQDPPEAVPALLARLGSARGVVFAGRRGRYAGLWRHLGSRLFKAALHRLTGRRLPVDAGLFLALDGETAHELAAAVAGDARPYLVGRLAELGVPLVSLPVARARNPYGRSGYREIDRLGLALAALGRALRSK